MRAVWRHLVVLGPESAAAAEASECAADQEAFWPYHDRLFDEQAGRTRGAFAPASLKRYAADLGLDGDVFGSCLDGRRHAARVQAETDLGRRLGIKSTPTLLVDGQRLVGPIDFEAVRRLIELARDNRADRADTPTRAGAAAPRLAATQGGRTR